MHEIWLLLSQMTPQLPSSQQRMQMPREKPNRAGNRNIRFHHRTLKRAAALQNKDRDVKPLATQRRENAGKMPLGTADIKPCGHDQNARQTAFERRAHDQWEDRSLNSD